MGSSRPPGGRRIPRRATPAPRPASGRQPLAVECLDDRALPSGGVASPGSVDPIPTDPAPSQRRELVVIDGSVPEAARLAADVASRAGATADVVVVRPDEDGVRAINRALGSVRDLDAIQIVSHADAGLLRLGAARVGGATFGGYAAEVRDWGRALRPGGDILLYGCNLAGSSAGRHLVRGIAAATGADVAASTDATGARSLGGNWALEFATGAIEAPVPFTPAVQGGWHHVLGVSPATDEFRLNQTTSDDQKNVDVAVRGDGSLVAVWESASSGNNGVYARLFGADGLPLGDEFRVHAASPDAMADPAVAADPSGRFVVAWVGAGQSGSAVVARVFDPSGAPLTGEVVVESAAAVLSAPDVAVGSDGTFVVVWQGPGGGNTTDVYGRRLSVTGAALGPAFRAHAATLTPETSPSVAVARSGDFVVAWTDKSGSKLAIRAQVFDRSGSGRGEFFAADASVYDAGRSAVAADAAGNFVVAWDEKAADGSQTAVLARRFLASGVPSGGVVVANVTTAYTQESAAVAMDGSGDFVVAWVAKKQDGDSEGIVARAFRADGAPATGEVLVNQTGGGRLSHEAAVVRRIPPDALCSPQIARIRRGSGR